ncbi:MAG: chemotaxis protein CheW [Leptolyngbyaceae bacterium]|nr:chemotaxis protein CheW [Leptolyngbyaceae bacterium]
MALQPLSRSATAMTQAGTLTPAQAVGVGQQFLRFHLIPDTTALLSVHQITEVLTVPLGQIVPIPQMPAWVMGIYNWRGEILWLADLGHLIGLTPLYEQSMGSSTCRAIVIHGDGQTPGKQKAGSQATGRKILGLVVNRVEDMEWCNPNLIQSPPAASVTPELVPFLRGYWLKPNHGEMFMVLDGESILAGMATAEEPTTVAPP